MSKTPEDLLYTESHEWVRLEGGEAVIGITDHAQQALNDIVYVELPKLHGEYRRGQEFGVVESVKSVSDLYMPLSGKVVEVNGSLEDEPETLNEDPYGKGWIARIKLHDPAEAKQLWDAQRYRDSIA